MNVGQGPWQQGFKGMPGKGSGKDGGKGSGKGKGPRGKGFGLGGGKDGGKDSGKGLLGKGVEVGADDTEQVGNAFPPHMLPRVLLARVSTVVNHVDINSASGTGPSVHFYQCDIRTGHP
jgi:hypothetical protein